MLRKCHLMRARLSDTSGQVRRPSCTDGTMSASALLPPCDLHPKTSAPVTWADVEGRILLGGGDPRIPPST
jgi:hypothetical protein